MLQSVGSGGGEGKWFHLPLRTLQKPDITLDYSDREEDLVDSWEIYLLRCESYWILCGRRRRANIFDSKKREFTQIFTFWLFGHFSRNKQTQMGGSTPKKELLIISTISWHSLEILKTKIKAPMADPNLIHFHSWTFSLRWGRYGGCYSVCLGLTDDKGCECGRLRKGHLNHKRNSKNQQFTFPQ